MEEMSIQFTPVNAQNIKEALALHVAAGQKDMVETVAECYAEAQQLALWRPVVIELQGIKIGFAMYGKWHSLQGDRVWLDRFMIDEKYQGKNYAKPVIKSLLQHIECEYNCREIYLSVYEYNPIAIKLYEYFGFVRNGEKDTKGESVMVRKA